MQAVRVYSSTVSCNFKYVSNAQLLITSHNLSKKWHFLLSEKRDALKYFFFLAGKGLSMIPPGLFRATIRLQLGGLFGVVIRLQLEGFFKAVIRLQLERAIAVIYEKEEQIL